MLKTVFIAEEYERNDIKTEATEQMYNIITEEIFYKWKTFKISLEISLNLLLLF